jgi:hypothetical protein
MGVQVRVQFLYLLPYPYLVLPITITTAHATLEDRGARWCRRPVCPHFFFRFVFYSLITAEYYSMQRDLSPTTLCLPPPSLSLGFQSRGVFLITNNLSACHHPLCRSKREWRCKMVQAFSTSVFFFFVLCSVSLITAELYAVTRVSSFVICSNNMVPDFYPGHSLCVPMKIMLDKKHALC